MNHEKAKPANCRGGKPRVKLTAGLPLRVIRFFCFMEMLIESCHSEPFHFRILESHLYEYRRLSTRRCSLKKFSLMNILVIVTAAMILCFCISIAGAEGVAFSSQPTSTWQDSSDITHAVDLQSFDENINQTASTSFDTLDAPEQPQITHKPAIDLDGYGAVSIHTDTYSGTDTWVKVTDHDGITERGSSHDVTVTFGSTIYTLNYQYNSDPYTAYYYLYVDSEAVSGDYVFTATDTAGNTASLTDTVVVSHLTPPSHLFCSVSGTIPTFSWTGDPDASYFRIRVFNMDGSSRWSGHSKSSPFTVPPGVLDPGTAYKYRIEARDGHFWGLEPDNISKSPAQTSDNPVFTTGNETQAPMIATNDIGIYTWMSLNMWKWVSFDILVYDAQGIPGNIKSVTVTTPGGEELPLYFSYNLGTNSGYYITEKRVENFVPGDYIVRVEDMDGKTDIFVETLDVSPLIPTASLDYSITESGVDFSWDAVQGAAMYALEIRDIDYNVIRRFRGYEPDFQVPEGFFKKNTPYRYRMLAYDEFPEDNISNVTGSSGISIIPVTTPYPAAGIAAPETELNQEGVFVIHRHAPNGDTPEYLLYFQVQVADTDGVPENISRVEVTYPDGMTKRELIFNHAVTDAKGVYSYYEAFENPWEIPAGQYRFQAFDADGRVSDIIPDILTFDPIPVPQNLQPVHGGTVFSTTPRFTWDPVPEASYYRVRIYTGYNTNTYHSPRLPTNAFTVPSDILQQGVLYSFRVDAYREETGNLNNLSTSKAYRDEMARFTVADAMSGIAGTIVDPDLAPIAGMEVVLENMDEDLLSTTLTAADGSFVFPLESEGEYSITVNPRMAFGLPSRYVKGLRAEAGETLDAGVIQVEQGAVVTGTVIDPEGQPISDIRLSIMGDNGFDSGFYTDSGGQFSIVLPRGRFHIVPWTEEEDAPLYYCAAHHLVSVWHDAVYIDMGNLMFYPADRIVSIQGSAIAPQRHDGDLFVAAFPDRFVLLPSTEPTAEPLSVTAGVDPENPIYFLPIPPENGYYLLNGFMTRTSSGKDSYAIVNRAHVIVGPAGFDHMDFTISEPGFFVLGNVSENGNIPATMGLYDVSGPLPVIAGLTSSDVLGMFEFFNVPAGEYRIGAFVPETGSEFLSPRFTVVDTRFNAGTIPLVNDGFGADTDRDRDLDGSNAREFSLSFTLGLPVSDHPMDLNADGVLDEADLTIFSHNFGTALD